MNGKRIGNRKKIMISKAFSSENNGAKECNYSTGNCFPKNFKILEFFSVFETHGINKQIKTSSNYQFKKQKISITEIALISEFVSF